MNNLWVINGGAASEMLT